MSTPTSTVGRNRKYELKASDGTTTLWEDSLVHLHNGDSLELYDDWPSPSCIVSDGGYGILGFEGDTSDHLELPAWYEPHIAAWSKHATPRTTLWFWNSEIGWAAVHPVLERHGWRYVNCNMWNKGKGHIAGNVNTKKIRRFPVVSEVCVQYVFEAKVDGLILRDWLRREWKRTGLPWREANKACGVKDAAVRKYLDKGHLWYFPPIEAFEKLVNYANEHGEASGKPYFSQDGLRPMTGSEWGGMRSYFNCPHGYTNVWERPALRGNERVKMPASNSKSAHLNQKPLDLMRLIIEASTETGDVVWEPFGGLFSASLASRMLSRRAFAAEIDQTYYTVAVERFRQASLF